MAHELIIRIAGGFFMLAVFVGGMLLIAKKLFPKHEDESDYLGGKPKEQRDKLWMD